MTNLPDRLAKMNVNKTAVVFLGVLAVSGCGEPERPRFVPAGEAGSSPKAEGPRAAGWPSDAVTVPRNIETH